MIALLGLSTFVGLAAALPMPNFLNFAKRDGSYFFYSGDGTVGDFWPSQDQWISSFDAMFAANTALMGKSCSQFSTSNNSGDEIAAIKSAIESASSEAGVDARFILAIMMQETKGCVRAPTTHNGVTNPGLLQCHNGAASCNSGGSVSTPCPVSTINSMISEGTGGTSHGDGLKQLIAAAGTSDVSKYYRAARMYNSGSIAGSGDLGDGIATHCYASDIANRLTGWVDGGSTCCLDEGCADRGPAKNPNLGAGSGSGSDKPTATVPAPGTATSKPTATATVPATTTAPGGYYAAAAATTTATAVSSVIPSQTSGAEVFAASEGECTSVALITDGSTCESVAAANGISVARFLELNPSVESVCNNMIAGQYYCVA